MAISPQLVQIDRFKNSIFAGMFFFIVYKQSTTILFTVFPRFNANVTFAAKFMPHSNGYIASYQVEQAATKTNNGTTDDRV